jgi:hypothetical protein
MTPIKKMLTGTTMLSPNAYVLRDPVTIGTAILSGLGVSTAVAGTVIAFGVTVAAVVGYVAVTAVTSWAISALSPSPPSFSELASMSSQGILTNARTPAAAHQYVYGYVRKGGVTTFIEATGEENKFLHIVIAMAGHEIGAFNNIYVNDETVTMDLDGFVTTPPWNSKIRIKTHLGSPTQAADPDLVAETSVTSAFQGKGIAYIYARLEYDPDVFANGVPVFTSAIAGKKVYDPRTSTTVYSNNSALCVRDYLTSEYGLGDNAIDDVAFAASANICDENVTLSGGGTQKRYTTNGIIAADMPVGAVLQKMMTPCAGTLFWGQGAWQLKVGYYTPPVKTFTLDDLRSPISLQTRISMRDIYNTVRGTFNDATQDFITVDYPQITSATFKAEDNNVEAALDLTLPFTTSAASAQRIAKLTLYRGREQIAFSADFGLAAFDVKVGDIVAMTNSRYGWTAKEFEVVSWKFFASSDAGDLRVNLTLRETSEAAFDWNAEETAIIANNTTLPDWRNAPLAGISIDAELRIVNQAVVGVLMIDLSSDGNTVTQYEVQYKKSSDSVWISLGTSGQARFEALNISDGFHDVRARTINTAGIRSAWNTVSNWYATLFAPLPADVTGFAANVVGNSLHLTWEPVPDLDLSHYKIRYANTTSGASYQNAIDVVQKIARPANSVTIPAKSGTYFIKAIDKLGNPSANSTSFVVYTNTANLEGLNLIETLTEHPSFSGAKTNTTIAEDDEGFYLTLTTDSDFDDLAGLFDDAAGLFDGGGGSGIQDNGTYEFANYVDLGDKYVSRVHADMKVDFLDFVNDFDSASGLFDSRLGDFDGDPAQFDTTTAKVQVATTDDDPAGTPTWSSWQDFIVGDLAARAIKFRAVLATSSETTAPLVRELTATVDMPDRVEADDDITFTGTTNISFPTAFKLTPAIGVAITLADGDRYVITSKTRSGFTITTYTGASVSTNAATIDYVAKGYGKELAA